jgi:cell wall-associated NlpC family hydrolase
LSLGLPARPQGDLFSLLLSLAHNFRRLAVALACVGALSTSSIAFALPAPGVQVADLAQQYVGSSYVWGGSSPAGFDCTGFVMWVFGQFNVALPHNEAGQLGSGQSVGADDLLPGDVVVFDNTYRSGLSHVGIYVGDGQFVHAVNESHGVMVNNLWDGYWGPRFVGASRPIADQLAEKASVSR